MKIGAYFAYWEQEWDVAFLPYVEKYKRLGLDVLEISGGGLMNMEDDGITALREKAEENDIVITCGIGLPQEFSTSSPDKRVRTAGMDYMKRLFDAMGKLGAKLIGGTVHSYWPADYSKPVEKRKEWEISIRSVKELADYAVQYGIVIAVEALNRFEQYLVNDTNEAVRYVEEVNRHNVKLLLDTFHMNIEEDNLPDAIRKAGKHLAHFHAGEANRKVPGKGSMPWKEIGRALHDIGYQGYIVMEPFVRPGGTVGSDIKLWRDLSGHADNDKLDRDIKAAAVFLKNVLKSDLGK